MSKIKDVPQEITLDCDSAFCLSILRAWVDIFPETLRRLGRLEPDKLHRAAESKLMSDADLLSAGYIGFVPITDSYRRFTNEADRVNKQEPHSQTDEFWKDSSAREKSAAGEFELARGQMKRLFPHLDALAKEFAGVSSYEELVNCREVILKDQSPFAPADRETYAMGPLHLWDLAKAVNEHRLVDMAFDTFGGWVLFVCLNDGVIAGHAVHPGAHRFGNFKLNTYIDIDEIRSREGLFSLIIDVPVDVQLALKALAARLFPAVPYEFMPPPCMLSDVVIPTKLVKIEILRLFAEA